MSAVYSYEATRQHDIMIEHITTTLELIVKEMRPEVAAIFSAFPYRGCRHSSHPAVSNHPIHSSPFPILAAWHAPQENCTPSKEIVVRNRGNSIYLHG